MVGVGMITNWDRQCRTAVLSRFAAPVCDSMLAYDSADRAVEDNCSTLMADNDWGQSFYTGAFLLEQPFGAYAADVHFVLDLFDRWSGIEPADSMS